MTSTIELPYSGELLLTQLMAYGTLVVLNRADARGALHHDPASLTYDPVVTLHSELPEPDFATALTATAHVLREVVEADLVPGASGNDRRSVIWARGSYANDPATAQEPVAKRASLLDAATDGGADARLVPDLLAALGCPATWGGGDLKPSSGATALDGVIGNHTSDFVRGLLRWARSAAEAPVQPLFAVEPSLEQMDKTKWAPPGTPARLDHQWLAVLGMTLLTVAHRSRERSRTPATWRASTGRRSGVAIPLLSEPTSLQRVRALLSSGALSHAAVQIADEGHADVRTGGALRSLGVSELALYERVDARGAGSSVEFSFRRGTRVAL